MVVRQRPARGPQHDVVEFRHGQLRLRPRRSILGRNTRSFQARLLAQLSGRNSRGASATGTSPRPSVSDTKVWQLAVLPSAETSCAATPTECTPFLGMAVDAELNSPMACSARSPLCRLCFCGMQMLRLDGDVFSGWQQVPHFRLVVDDRKRGGLWAV